MECHIRGTVLVTTRERVVEELACVGCVGEDCAGFSIGTNGLGEGSPHWSSVKDRYYPLSALNCHERSGLVKGLMNQQKGRPEDKRPVGDVAC